MGPFRKKHNSEEFITLINGKVVRKEDAQRMTPSNHSALTSAASVESGDDSLAFGGSNTNQHQQRRKKVLPPSCLRVKTVVESIENKKLAKKKKKKSKGNSSSSSSSHRKRGVHFHTLEVREYPMILGDNPSVEEGLPLTIDWGFDPTTQFVLDVEQFENMRGERRRSETLKLPRAVREQVLINVGTTPKEMVNCIRQLRKDQHSRLVSRTQDDAMHEKVENASRKFKKLVLRKSQYERDLEAACPTQTTAPKATKRRSGSTDSTSSSNGHDNNNNTIPEEHSPTSVVR